MVKIYTEGHDSYLIRKLLDIQGKVEGSDYEIQEIKGNLDSLFKLEPSLMDHKLSGKELVFIVDADDETKANGGYAEAKEKLDRFSEENEKLDFKYFILPNNKENGDFEHLLERIINNDHQSIMTCFEAYVECLKQSGYNHPQYNVPNKKVKIYAYCTTLGKSLKNGDYGFEDDSIWNLESEELKPLKDFLTGLF